MIDFRNMTYIFGKWGFLNQVLSVPSYKKNEANTSFIKEVAGICAPNRDNPAKKAQPTHDCFLQNLIAFRFNKTANPPNPKCLLLRAYILKLCTLEWPNLNSWAQLR